MSSSPTTTTVITKSSEAEAVAKLIEERPLVIEGVAERDVIIYRDGAIAKLVTGESLFPEPLKPDRREGISRLETLESFIAHVNRHKGETSVLFASKGGTPSIQAIYDYNQGGEESTAGERARFRRHRAVYTFPLSKEWLAWSRVGSAMSQVDFAAFIEDRIGDVTSTIGTGMKETMERLFVPAQASGARLLELSRGLDIGENARVSNHVKLATGESRVSFSSEHVDGNGSQVDVPQAFVIGIPVFEHGQPFQILVRLRYRLKDNRLSWFLQPHDMDAVFAVAFEDACRDARDGAGLQLFVGTPEAA